MKKLTLKRLRVKNIINKNKEVREQSKNKIFISSGSYLQNLALTGNIDKGYCVGRVVNIIGDKSSGKTLEACELINVVWYQIHKMLNKQVLIIYDDPERTFDFELAEKFNMPVDSIIFKHSKTVEEFEANLWNTVKNNPDNYIIVYVLDSLDSIEGEAEQKKHMKNVDAKIKKIIKDQEPKEDSEDKEDKEDKQTGSYGTGKAKAMSDFFKNSIQAIADSNCLLFIISQVRDDIGVRFGSKQKRSGGRALDFYASQVIWLKELEQIKSTKYKIPQGIMVECYITKNKVGKPYRKAKFQILYEYGIDNITSVIDFCIEHGAIKQNGSWYEWEGKSYHKDELIKYFDNDKEDFSKLLEYTQEIWDELEEDAKVARLPKWRDE